MGLMRICCSLRHFSTSIQINSPDCAKFHQWQLPEQMTQQCAHHKNTHVLVIFIIMHAVMICIVFLWLFFKHGIYALLTVQGSMQTGLAVHATARSCPSTVPSVVHASRSPYCRALQCLIKLLGAVIFV